VKRRPQKTKRGGKIIGPPTRNSPPNITPVTRGRKNLVWPQPMGPPKLTPQKLNPGNLNPELKPPFGKKKGSPKYAQEGKYPDPKGPEGKKPVN